MCHYLVVSTGVGIDGSLIYSVHSSVMCISANALSLQFTSIIFITEVLSEGNALHRHVSVHRGGWVGIPGTRYFGGGEYAWPQVPSGCM